MRNNRLLPYETIVQATSGEPEAVGTVLQYYRRRIQCAARMPVRGFIPSQTRFHICLFKETSQGVHAPFLTYM